MAQQTLGYKTIANVSRSPSVLHGSMTVPVTGEILRSPSPNFRKDSPPQSARDLEPIAEQEKCSIQQWGAQEVLAWLAEIGFEEYQVLFTDHAISSGRILLSLCEHHLREMGVAKVGHRLEIMRGIEELKKRAGLVFVDGTLEIGTVVDQLDTARAKKHMMMYPKRIILVRHAESAGNVDKSLYSVLPDSKLAITELGRQQADAAGTKLRELIGLQTVTFYVSPFLRSKETYEHIRRAFQDEQVLHYCEDPRLREQEWGNFQDPAIMEAVMNERRKIGAFYYRFPTGESGADVFDRVSTFLETLYRDMQAGQCGENAILISHGLFCRLFLMRFYHWKVEKFHKLWNFQNCQHAIMELQPGGKYTLITELKSDH